MRRIAAALAAALVVCAMAPHIAVAQPRASEAPFFTARYDSRLKFRTISTPRFDIHYHQREEALARRLAAIVVTVAHELEARLGRPRSRLHVVLVDQADEANGWATVIPYNLIEISAAPPRSAAFIGNTDDWLRLVFIHEYTHVVHLEKSGGWLGSFRRVFGRVPLFYSNLFLPKSLIEGLATYEESEMTGRGRMLAGDFRTILDRGGYQPLDRAAGGVVAWPSGHRPYLYGGFFHECLAANKFGDPKLERLIEETARRLPFFGTRAFRDVYGKSLGTLWEECLKPSTPPVFTFAGAKRVTQHGFVVTSPAFSASGRLFYSVANPHGFPGLMELTDAGPRLVTTRFGGARLSVANDLLLFDQLEVVRDVERQSDIYTVPVNGGTARRLTRGARAADPDVSPDGRTIVCTVQQTGRRILATFAWPRGGAIAEPQPLVAEDATEFAAPRWSPDGRSIVAERQRLGGPSELVIVDVASRSVRTLVSSRPTRNTAPTWLPDGQTILFAADRYRGAFVLVAVDVATGTHRRLSSIPDGAQAPALSPDGRRLVFVGQHAGGFDLYELPLADATWENVEPAPLHPKPEIVPVPLPALSDRAYSPWSTLAPRFWLPVFEAGDDGVLVGGATSGYDALGRHGYGATLAWSTEADRSEWQVDYVYARWRPAFFVSASHDVDVLSRGTLQSREMNAGILLPTRRVRWSMTSLAGVHLSRDRLECPSCPDPDRTSTRSALRGGWRVSSAKAFGYSISAEKGASLTVTGELARRALGSDGDATAATADARSYWRVFPRHGVFAARIAAAVASGDEPLRRAFNAGGSAAQLGGFDFGSGAIGLLRGYEESDLRADRAAVLNLDYRVPLAWVERGVGTLPLLLRSIHGAVFFDAGNAWNDRFRRAEIRRSLGAELSFDVVVGYELPVTIATGAAWRRDGTGERRGVAGFVRVGRAF